MSEPIEVVLDATMLDTYEVCPAKFNYRFRLNKTAPTKAQPLDRGDLLHKGLEPYYRALKERLSFEEALERAKLGFDLAAVDSEQSPEDVRFQKNTLIENLSYWQHRDARMEILDVEVPFAYELFTDSYIRITMIGKIDLLVNEDRYERLPYDHKSYTRDFPLLRTANQFTNYAYAVQSNYLFVNRVGLQTSYPPEKKHKRIPLSYDPIFLEQWRSNVVKIVYRYVESATENSWPMNFTSCDKYNRICEYHDVCNSSGEQAKVYKLDVQFKDAEKWDVAKSLGLKK